MPCDSSSWRVMGCEGLKWPSRPSVQSPGISQMRKKPSMWSIRYAWKYLDTDRAMSYEVALFFCLMVQSIIEAPAATQDLDCGMQILSWNRKQGRTVTGWSAACATTRSRPWPSPPSCMWGSPSSGRWHQSSLAARPWRIACGRCLGASRCPRSSCPLLSHEARQM
jgi:hypothetical protein